MKRRQFIAGAVCPECQQMDRIVVEQDGDESRRLCVACGFSDSVMPATGVVPGTRFTRSVDATGSGAQAGSSTVRILPLEPMAGTGKPEKKT